MHPLPPLPLLARLRTGLVLVLAIASAAGGGEPVEMRIESEVFADGGATPIATSLTLFRDGLAWDFLDGPKADGEIVLHDPARERVVVIDPRRNVKTEVDALRLERLSVSLAAWARRSDDRVVQWAGGPDFDIETGADAGTLRLSGPRVRYEVVIDDDFSPEAAETYRRFADTAVLLKALLHPGGLPPFPRLALNKRVSADGGIPGSVTLEIDAKAPMLGLRSHALRSVHKVHPRLLASDGERIEDAEARVALAEAVDLAAYVEPETAKPVTAAK